ncbi:MAG: hypothetical protein EKK57_01865 [Proteobacteria bacterium]|nr:MAG: hypothetical protein EKK57_01865 [Pseudomonadota bacterium]
MRKQLNRLLCALLGVSLIGCNSGSNGTNTSQSNTIGKSSQSLFANNLGWYILINNDSDMPYLVTKSGDSSNWHNKDLDEEIMIPPHSDKMIYTEASDDRGSRGLIVKAEHSNNQKHFTLRQDKSDLFGAYSIIDNSTNERARAVFNDRAKRALLSKNTAAYIGTGVFFATLGGVFIAHFKFTKPLKKELSDYQVFVKNTDLKGIQVKIVEMENLYNLKKEFAQLLDIELLLKDDNYLRSLMSSNRQGSAQYEKANEALLAKPRIKELAIKINQSEYHQISADETFRQLTVLREQSDALTRKLSQAELAIPVLEKRIRTNNIIIGVSGFGLGAAAIGVDAAGLIKMFENNKVLTGIQISADGSIKGGVLNDAPVGSYIKDCDVLSSESNIITGACRYKDSDVQVSFLSLNSLRPNEDIVNVDGMLVGGDSYHKDCTSSFFINGVLTASCKIDTNIESSPTKLVTLNYGSDCDAGSEVRYENGALTCPSYNNLKPELLNITNNLNSMPGMVFATGISSLSTNSNGFYALSSSAYGLLKCDFNRNCNVIDDYHSQPLGASFDDNGNGFVITKEKYLNRYAGDKFVGRAHTFADEPSGVSYVSSNKAVYVTTSGKELKKCSFFDYDNCSTLDSFRNKPIGVAFNGSGKGFVITDNNDLDMYENDHYTGKQHHFEDPIGSLSYVGDKVFLFTNNNNGQIIVCDDNLNGCKRIDGYPASSPDGFSVGPTRKFVGAIFGGAVYIGRLSQIDLN